jgi:hypothetical protein
MSTDRSTLPLGPDPLALIQAFEADFSCSVEWMRLKNEGLFGLRRAVRWRR